MNGGCGRHSFDIQQLGIRGKISDAEARIRR
jgi:hypothetical protein